MDALGTAQLRERVLAAWAASPARFREDANAEEELALGAYRDRLVVELTQNAADAAARADVPGRLLLRLDGSTLIAANTGAPLDTAGVEGLSTLRASPKRESETVGRFGVGFAAVLAVTDEPVVVSHGNAVRWSRQDALALVTGVSELAAEVTSRGTAVPVLRLPFSAEPAQWAVPDGYDTCVVLPLRNDAAVTAVREMLSAVDDALLLLLPALTSLTVETDKQSRTLQGTPASIVDADAGISERHVGLRRWRLAQLTGRVAPELLTNRPVEERARPEWSVTAAVPLDEGTSSDPFGPAGLADPATDGENLDHLPCPAPLPASVPPVVHAPTPTDDTSDLPALVIAGFPLDSTRRRVASGQLTEFLARQVGVAYARLVASFSTPAVLTLVPGPIGASEVDGLLHHAVLDALSSTAFIPAADGRNRLRPAEVTLVDGLPRGADPGTLAPFVAGLPAAGWERPDVLNRLKARVLPLAEFVDGLGSLNLPAAEWRVIYAALEGADPESLGALPVPLSDGRLVRGPRGVLLPGGIDPERLEPFQLRVVHPEAVHPLLARLGASEANAAAVIRDPAVRAAVQHAMDEDNTALADAVLHLVAASGLTHQDEPWMAQLPLPDETGEPAPAADLLLPGVRLLDVLDADPAEYAVATDFAERHGIEVLRAAGVRDGFAIVRESDITLDPDLWHNLDDEDSWVRSTLDTLHSTGLPPLIVEFTGVSDLDLVRPSAWPDVLSWLAADPETRAAVVGPMHVVTDNGARYALESYTAWWLRKHATVAGKRLDELCTSDADPIVRRLLTLVSRESIDIDDGFASAIGIARVLSDIPGEVLLNRLGDEALTLPSAELAQVYAELGGRDSNALASPRRVRVPDGTASRIVDAGDAVVCDGPHWLQLDLPAVIPGSSGLADVLDVDLASDVYSTGPLRTGQVRAVPDVALALLPAAPDNYIEHDDLIVGGRSVDWWFHDGAVHAATMDGLARGLAWSAGAWPARWLLAQALEAPDTVASLLAEEAFGAALAGASAEAATPAVRDT